MAESARRVGCDFVNLLTVNPHPNHVIGANDGSSHIDDSSSDDDGANTMGGSIRSNTGRRSHNNRCRSSTDRMDNSSLAPQSPRKRQREPVRAAERKQPIPRRPAGVIGISSFIIAYLSSV